MHLFLKKYVFSVLSEVRLQSDWWSEPKAKFAFEVPGDKLIDQN